MAHKKSGGSTRLGRNSQPKYLGLKKAGGQAVKIGNIIIRQKGTKFHPGQNVKIGRDFTIFAARDGHVAFKKKKIKAFNGQLKKRVFVNVV